MALRQALGYALRSRPLGEADLIVELYTQERGRVRAVAKSARRIKSRFGSAFEPFTRSHFVYFQRDKDDLGRISSSDIERSYFETLAGVEEAGAAAYMAELIIGFSPEHDPSRKLFRLIGAVLDALEAGVPVELAMRYFEVWVLRLAGLLPDLYHCGSCGAPLGEQLWVSDTSLEFLCKSSCAGTTGRRRLGARGRALLADIIASGPQAVSGATHSSQAQQALGAATEVLICGHLDRMPKSLRYLRRMRRHWRAG